MESETSANKLPASQSISLILTFCSISALFIYLIYSKNIAFGSELGGWTYTYLDQVNTIPFWIPLIVLFLTGAVIYRGSRHIQNHEKVTLFGCFLIAVVIQVLFIKICLYPLDQLIKSNTANSFYTLAIKYSPIQILSQYQSLAQSFPLHAKANLPGKILFFQLLSVFTSSPMVMGYLIISISTLGGIILYGICKHLFKDKTAGLYAFVLYMLIPCKQEFFPILNTITPLFTLICLYLFIIYLDSKNKLLLVLMGIALFIQAIFEPSPFVTGILFVGIFIQTLGQKKIFLKELIPILLIPTLTFVAICLAFYLFFSFNLWQAWDFIIKDAVNYNVIENRSYSIWLKENLKEFFYGAGLPTMMIFIYFGISIFSQPKIFKRNILRWPIENIFVLSLILTFCVVLFSGINRGETTRLWIYLAVFFQVPISFFMAKSVKNNLMFFILAGTLIAQTLMTLQRVSFISP